MSMTLLLWLGAHLFLHDVWIFLTVFLTKGLILFGVAYAATRLVPSLPAEHKYAMWLLIIFGFVVLPVGRLLMPVLPVSLPDPNEGGSIPHLVAASLAYGDKVTSIIGVALGGTAAARRPILPLLPVLVWSLGVTFFILRYAAGRVALRRLAACQLALPPRRLPMLEALAKRMKIHRAVSLAYNPRCAIPMTYGWLNPRIVLPRDSLEWPDERLRAVMAHEFAHVKRADPLSSALAYVVCALQWFNPFAWLAREFMLREAEMSCDLEAISNGIPGTEYASALVDIVRAARGHVLLPGAYGIIGGKNLLRERIQRVLTHDVSRRPNVFVHTGRLLLASLAILLLVFAMTYSVTASEKLYGTWVKKVTANSSRFSADTREYKFAWSADGTGLRYDECMPELPISKGEFVIEKKWSDRQGNTWYKLRTKWSSRTLPLYALIRVEQSGKVYEYDASSAGYPQDFSGPIGAGSHQLYGRQQSGRL